MNESRSFDLAATASISLPLEHTTRQLHDLSTSKENFARASRRVEIYLPEVDTITDFCQITTIFKEKPALVRSGIKHGYTIHNYEVVLLPKFAVRMDRAKAARFHLGLGVPSIPISAI